MGIEKGITKEVTVGEQAGSSEGLKNDAAINGEATNVETKETDRGISLVIPYLASEAQGDELKYALRSILQNARFPGSIVIIGDKPEWLEETEAIFLGVERTSDNPQIDTMNKLKMAISSDLVSEKFIFSNDDIYFVSPVALCDIETLKCVGDLNPNNFNGKMYKENMERTIELLKNNNLSILNFGTHTPFFFEKDKVAEIFEKFPEINEEGYLFESIYFNYHYKGWNPIILDWKTDNWLLPFVTPNPNMDIVNKLISGKKFVNNATTGFSEMFVNKLKELFPEKLDFEK